MWHEQKGTGTDYNIMWPQATHRRCMQGYPSMHNMVLQEPRYYALMFIKAASEDVTQEFGIQTSSWEQPPENCQPGTLSMKRHCHKPPTSQEIHNSSTTMAKEKERI